MENLSEAKDFVKLLKRHGHSVTELNMSECTIGSRNVFVEMINSMPNLEVLTMDNFSGWRKLANRRVKLANSDKMKRILTTQADDCFLECFQGWNHKFAAVGCTRKLGEWVCRSENEYVFD